MKMIPLGSTDITLSRMGLGTWAIGGGPAWNGDLDLQIFFFDAPSSGLRAEDADVCVMGMLRDPATGAETPFQGCDSAEISPN